jgi:hypothetical protein
MKLQLTTLSLGLAISAFSQPLGSPPSNNTNAQAGAAWYRGGNSFGTTSPPGANIFGTFWNSPVYHFTNGQQRMVVNGNTSVPTTVAAGLTNTDGFIGVNIAQPWSRLHIGGQNLAPFGGYRPWMREGIIIQNANDQMWLGVKRWGAIDQQNATVNWGDDPAYPSVGPDHLVFNFTSSSYNSPYPPSTTTPNSGSLEGREIMRLTDIGNVGIGPRFSNVLTTPQNMLHINNFASNPAYMQVSNEGATGQTANDGFHFGITNTGVAEINQKENLDFRFYTFNQQQAVIKNTGWIGFNTNTPNNELEITSRATTPYGLTGSGLRFTNMKSTNALTANPGAGVLSVDANGDVIYVPGGGASIANNGVSVNAGVVQLGVPCSIANIPSIVANQFTTSRMIANRNFDFWFASLNNETGGVGVGGQPVLPFCGTGNTFEISANSKNTQYGSANASGLRFTKLISTSPIIANGVNGVDNTKVLSVDGDGDVVLVNGGNIGNICGGTTNPLLNDWEIPLGNKRYYFTGQSTTNQNAVAVGYNCSTALPGKFNVFEHQNGQSSHSFAGHFVNDHSLNGPAFITHFGVYGQTTNSTLTDQYHVGVGGRGYGTQTNIGVVGLASPTNFYYNQLPSFNLGGLFLSDMPTGGRLDNQVAANYGIRGEAKNSTVKNIGVYGEAPVASLSWGLYVNGDAYTTASIWQTSDKMFKTNINAIKAPLENIMKLKPSYFEYDLVVGANNGINLPTGKTYGFIAQEVEPIFPELVGQSITEGVYDTITGGVITAPTTIKTLNYTGMIGIAVGAIQELNTTQNGILATLAKAGLSDAQVKANINPFNALAKIKTLSPVKYNFTNANVPQLSFTPNADYGFVAQQLQTVYPELVDTVRIPAKLDSVGNVINPSKVLKTVNYKAMSALLVRSVQEQQITIDSLRSKTIKQDSINNAVQAQLAAIVAQMTACCAHNTTRAANSTINSLDIDLTDKDAIVLNQNVPNPFAEQTTITYNVPEKVGKAQILFFNAAGQIIQTVDVKTRGKGKINVFASDLSSGLYHYSLVADGVIIDSKKMVRE